MKAILFLLAACGLGVLVAVTVSGIKKQVNANDALASLEKERAALEEDKSYVASQIENLEQRYGSTEISERWYQSRKERMESLEEERADLLHTMTKVDHAGLVASAQYKLKQIDEELPGLRSSVAKAEKEMNQDMEKRASYSEEISELRAEAKRIDMKILDVERRTQAHGKGK